jgi:PAS domain-containing protein
VKGEEKTQEQIITELRQRVAELEKSETQCERDGEKLPATNNEPRVTIENLPQKIFYKNGNSVYVSCNESYANGLKTKPEEIKAYLEFSFMRQNKYNKRILEVSEIYCLLCGTLPLALSF